MIISYAWTTEALLAERKKVTRRDWSREYAARFRAGTAHLAYNRNPRIGGKKVGDVRIITPPYPERACDMPDEDYELEGFAYMEERGILINRLTPREYFEGWRQRRDVLFVVRFDLVFKCDRCGAWTTSVPFGPYYDKRLCPLCWIDWQYYADRHDSACGASSTSWEEVYSVFCLTERKGLVNE